MKEELISGKIFAIHITSAQRFTSVSQFAFDVVIQFSTETPILPNLVPDQFGPWYNCLMYNIAHDMARHLAVLCQVYVRLRDAEIDWVITGSLGFALQGVTTPVHDIDVQTNGSGDYAIEKRFARYVINPVEFSATDRICSHFGALSIDGIRVEIMGDIQKRQPDGAWSAPADLQTHRRWVDIGGINIPVLDLRYELTAYAQLGRWLCHHAGAYI